MKKLILSIFAFIVLITMQITVQAQTWAWKNQMESSASSSNEIVNDVAVDGFGNSYAVGYFNGTIMFKGNNITTSGSNDIFISKTDKEGKLIWVKTYGGKYDDQAKSITLDNNGNPYITGYYTGAIQFDTTALDSINPVNQIFIARLDTAGNAKWAVPMLATKSGSGEGIEYSAKSGLLLVSGKMGGTVGSKGQILLTNPNGKNNIYLGKIDTLGNWSSATRIVGNLDLTMGGFGIDKNENMFVSFSTYFGSTTALNAYKADGTTAMSLVGGLTAFNQKNNSVVFLVRINNDYSTSAVYSYQNYDVTALRGFTVGIDNNPIMAFRYRIFNGTSSSYQIRKFSNDIVTYNPYWARNITTSYFDLGGITIDKNLNTSVLFATNAGVLDNSGTVASSVTLATGLNFYLAKINSSGQWSTNPAIGSNGSNNSSTGTFFNGGLAIDTNTNEVLGACNLAFANFKANYFDLNSKAPLGAGKYDAFTFKFGCVNAGFYSQPKDSLVCPNATLYAGTQPLGSNFTYTWKKNNQVIGSGSPILSKAGAVFADSGYYKLTLRSVCFNDTTYATSDSVKLGVKPAPVILEQPKSDTLCMGQYIKLRVKVAGSGLTYSWNYTGCSNCVLSTTDSMLTQAGSKYSAASYYTTIKDACNRTLTSANAVIVLETPITAYSITAGATTCEQGAFILKTAATTTGNYDVSNTPLTYVPKLTYSWKKDNVEIPNSNFSSLEMNNVAISDSGLYTVDISNRGCKTPVTTAAVKVKVNTANSAFVSENNIKLYLPFNGSVMDESGKSNYSTTTTATFTSDRNTVSNTALNLTGGSQVRLPDSTFVTSTIGTLSFWIKTATLNQVIFGMQNKALNAAPNVQYINGYIDYSGLFRGALYTGTTFTSSAINNNVSQTVVNDNKWHNIVISYNTNTQSIYIDGILQYTINAAIQNYGTKSFVNYPLSVCQFGSTTISGANIYKNLNTGNGASFTGLLDDISVHGVAYDACDVARLYSLGVKITPVGIDENASNSNFTIAPNPFENELTLNSETAFGKVSISDITGKIVFETEKTESVLKINTTQLQSGIYFVKLGNEVIKVVK